MSDPPLPANPRSLSPTPAEQWTLHHVLLDRLGEDPTVSTEGDAPAELRRAFETLDAGERRFTLAQLEAIRDVLATYHHSTTWWVVERPRLESLLSLVTTRIERAA
jgi:hypothetical protein